LAGFGLGLCRITRLVWHPQAGRFRHSKNCATMRGVFHHIHPSHTNSGGSKSPSSSKRTYRSYIGKAMRTGFCTRPFPSGSFVFPWGIPYPGTQPLCHEPACFVIQTTFPRWSLLLAEMLAHFATLMVLSCVAGSLYISFQKQDFYLTPEGFFSPLNNAFVIPICMVVSGIIAYVMRQATKDSIFSAGFFAGEITVLVSLAANCLVMFLCGVPDLASVFLITLLVHLPLAIVEGLITGSVIQFIHKVKPELMPLSSTSDQKRSSIPDTLKS
jgi:Cobalt uptake substrate-specific transmembrane region